MSPLAPAQHRLEMIDALRGFALAMILVVNMAHFSGYFFRLMLPDFEPWPSELQGEFGMIFFFEGKGYTLFSLLFGLSISMQMERAAQRNTQFGGFHIRRMLILAVIGICHSFFLWYGDILLLYALLGMFIPYLRHLSIKSLILTGLLLLFATVPQQLIMAATLSAPTNNANTTNGIQSLLDMLGKGSYWEALKANAYLCYMKWMNYLYSGRLFKVLGLFMLGYAVGRSQIIQNAKQHLPTMRRYLPPLVLLGLLGNLGFLYLHKDISTFNPRPINAVYEGFYGLGIVPMGLSYALVFILLWHAHPKLKAILSIFAPYGRLALTNYLIQSVICVVIFYGWGFGLMPKWSFMAALLIVPFLVGLQILYSRIWLWYFHFGPIEWVWRICSYGKVFPIRR